MYDKTGKVHNPLSKRDNVLCNCCPFTFPFVNNRRQFLRCHFRQILLVVSLGPLMLPNVSRQLQGSPGNCYPKTSWCISSLHYFFNSLHSCRRKLGLVNLVSFLPNFVYDPCRLSQSESTFSWSSITCKAYCFSPSFALMDKVKYKTALSDNCTLPIHFPSFVNGLIIQGYYTFISIK